MTYRKDPIFEIDPYPDHLYYDLNIMNLRNNNLRDNMHLQFRETRTIPIIHNAEEYYMSVVRFFVSSYSLPILFFAIEPGQADINKGAYTVSLQLRLGLTDYDTIMVPVRFYPQDQHAPLPIAPNLTSNGYQQESPYYFCYSYDYVINLFNLAFENAYNQLRAKYPGNLELQYGGYPFLAWDHGLNRPVMYARNKLYNTLSGQIKVFFNRESWNLFNGFSCKYYTNTDTYNRNYEVLFYDLGGANLVINDYNSGINRLIKVVSETDPTANWSPIASVLFTTNQLPIVPNALSLPKIYDNGLQISLTADGNNTQNIISDIVSDEYSYRPHLLYVPFGQNRMIDLKNNAPIQNIDVSVWYRTKLNGLYPFVLPPGGSASMKLLFERKPKYRNY